jgi:glycosyltransferase involved in cell wall biosynthesis
MPEPTTAPAFSLVMPCYNEADCLRETVGEVITAFASAQIPLQLVLVENGSLDGTGKIIDELVAEGHPVTKVYVPVNQGYGYGVLQGLKRCEAPFVGILVADGQVAAEVAVAAYQQARSAGRPTLAKVRRRFRQDSWRRKVVSVIYNLGMHVAFGWLGSLDLNGSPKVMPRDVYEAMDLQSKDWFLDPEIMIKAKYLGVRVFEHDAEGLSRRGGKSNVRATTILNFLKNIAAYRFGGALHEWKKSARRTEWMRRAAAASASGVRP